MDGHLIIAPLMLPLLINAITLLITLIYGCREDIRERAVPVVMWYPMIAIAIPTTLWFWYSVITDGYLSSMIPFLPLIIFFTISFYLFTYFNLMGMADTKALILIVLFIPCFPLVPILGYPPFGYPPFVFFPFTVLFNAVIINLILPVGIFLMNVRRGNKAPWPYLFLGFPVDGNTIEDQFGIVMEEFSIKNGELTRSFIQVGRAMKDMIRGGKRIYTKSLKEEPDVYKKELAMYRKAGKVWISYGVPFLIPITLGLISALIIGDVFSGFVGIFL